MSDMTVVGIADMKLIRSQGTLVTYALGSCVGVCIYDSAVRLASMIHVMLPYSPSNVDNVFKYADTGIPATIRKMEAYGALKRRMCAKVVGGAKMFNIPGDGDFGNIGNRNVSAVLEMLKKESIPIMNMETGGAIARTVFLSAETGEISIKTFGRDVKII